MKHKQTLDVKERLGPNLDFVIRPVTEFRNQRIKLFQEGPVCQGSKYVSTFLVGVFKADDLGVIFHSPIPPSFLNNVTCCFPD